MKKLLGAINNHSLLKIDNYSDTFAAISLWSLTYIINYQHLFDEVSSLFSFSIATIYSIQSGIRETYT